MLTKKLIIQWLCNSDNLHPSVVEPEIKDVLESAKDSDIGDLVSLIGSVLVNTMLTF